MANVFVSYARDDRARIQPLVSALEAEGLSVWWDPALIPGRRFRQMIAHELSTADAVLVIWTRQALDSTHTPTPICQTAPFPTHVECFR